MVGINEIIDFFFDGSGTERDIVFWKELLLLIIVDFIVFNGANFRLSCFFGAKEFVQVLLLS